MKEQDYQDSLKACYALAHSLATNGSEQHALISAIKGIERDNNVRENVIQAVLGMFYDGLAFGNWPWMKNGVNILKGE